MKRTLAVLLTLLAGAGPSALPSPAGTEDDAGLAPPEARWIWFAGDDPAGRAPAAKRCFRTSFVLPAGLRPTCAQFVLNADDGCTPYINGRRLPGKRGGWNEFDSYDVTEMVTTGRNVLAVEAENGAPGPAGVIGWIEMRIGRQKRIAAATGSGWKASDRAPAGWEAPGFDDGAWPPARELGLVSMAPWGGRLQRVRMPLMRLTARSGTNAVPAEEARRLIEEDWLLQADEGATIRRVLREIGWARELAARLAAHPARPDFGAELAALSALEAKASALPPAQEDEASEDLYLAVRRIKRSIMFRNPLLDFDRVLLLDGPTYAGAHESAHRNGYHYGPRTGSRLLVLEGLRPDGAERELLTGAEGYVMRMDLSYDAAKVVYSLKPAAEASFHLYEVGLDGAGRRQLTDSPYDDMDPAYLPDGHILFSTSRGNTFVRCLPPSASTVLARCDPDGRNIYLVSRNNEPDYTPAVLNDGRVLYTRWEYTERPLWRLQKLWTINPDGTGESAYWGNGSAYPDMLWEARPIPGDHRVMFSAVGHHDVITSCLGILDVGRGLQWPDGVAKLTPEIPWPEVGDAPEGCPAASPAHHRSGPIWSARCPYPLGPEDFLASVARTAHSDFALFLMDIHGNRELVYTGRQTVWYAQPVRPRPLPTLIPDRVAWPAAGEAPKGGVLFSANVLAGAGDLPSGSVKYLRVLEMDPKTYTMGFKSWRHSGPAISVIQEDGVKRILGTVPVGADGSVAFKAPAGRALHFQLLDGQQRCLQVMRSFTGVMPGETRGCLGCHPMHSTSPEGRSAVGALRRTPSEIEPPPWGAGVSIGYERFCQPVLDKYCGRCHQGNGEGRAKLDLTLRGGVKEGGIEDPRLWPFKEPYLTLVGQAWGGPKPEGRGAALGLAGCLNVEQHHQYGPLAPGRVLSSASPPIEMVTSGKHHDVRITGEDLLKLTAWVDCNCVYRGDEDVRQIPDPPPATANRFPVPIRVRTAPRIERLQPVTDPPRKSG